MAEDDPDEDEAEEGEGRRKIEVKARQASHTNYLLMRGYCVPGIVSLRNLNTNDNIVVNSCTMRVKLRRSPSHQLFPNRGESRPGDLGPAPPLRASVGSLLSSHPPLPGGDLLDKETQAKDRLPRKFTRLLRTCQDFSRLERFTDRCIHQCGYSSEDLQAILDVSSAIEAGQCFGCERVELARMFPDLAEVQGDRTRTFLQYLEVGICSGDPRRTPVGRDHFQTAARLCSGPDRSGGGGRGRRELRAAGGCEIRGPLAGPRR